MAPQAPKQLAKYANSDYVVFRCKCDNQPFKVTLDQLADADGWIECECCALACDRLLADGTWQSEAERQQENNKAYQRSLK